MKVVYEIYLRFRPGVATGSPGYGIVGTKEWWYSKNVVPNLRRKLP